MNIPTPTCLTILDDAYTVFLNSRTYRPAINTTAGLSSLYFVTLLLQYKLLFIVIVVPAPLEPVVKEIIEEEEGPPEVS